MHPFLLLMALAPWFAVAPPDPVPNPRADRPRPPRRETAVTPQVVAQDAATEVLDELGAARSARCVRLELDTAPGTRAALELVGDSARVDGSWRRRFHRLCLRLPPADCGEPSAGRATSAPLVRVEGLDPGSTPAVELDFDSRCVRFVRQGGVVAMRGMGGRDAQFLALAREVLPADPRLREHAGRVLPQPIDTPLTPVNR